MRDNRQIGFSQVGREVFYSAEDIQRYINTFERVNNDVIIYAVEKSLDSYKFNLLHNKQMFITQLKNNSLGARTIDEGSLDEKSGMNRRTKREQRQINLSLPRKEEENKRSEVNFSEYIAILSGNTDLLEKAKIEKKVAALESERQAFTRSKSTSQSRIDGINHSLQGNMQIIERIKGDMALLESREVRDIDGCRLNKITLTGVDGDDPKVIGAKLAEINEKARTHGQDLEIGSLYGFRIVVKTEHSSKDLLDLTQNKFVIIGDSGMRYTYNNGNIAADPLLASTNFLSALEKMPSLIERYEKDSEKLQVNLPVLREIVGSSWKKESELKELKVELTTLDRKIQLSLKPIDQSDGQQEPIPDQEPILDPASVQYSESLSQSPLNIEISEAQIAPEQQRSRAMGI